MTRLAAVLAGAMAEAWSYGGAKVSPAWRLEQAQMLVAAIPDAQREAMEVGLLVAEAERLGWPVNRMDVIRVPYRREPLWQVVASRDRASISGEGQTLHAALTALLAKLGDPS